MEMVSIQQAISIKPVQKICKVKLLFLVMGVTVLAPSVLIPFESGHSVFLVGALASLHLACLNPFECRAVTVSVRLRLRNVSWVLIPLNAGQLLFPMVDDVKRQHDIVLIPLNAGQLLFLTSPRKYFFVEGLNPFECRAVTVSVRRAWYTIMARLNPFECRAVTVSYKREAFGDLNGLNPFECRAVTVSH